MPDLQTAAISNSPQPQKPSKYSGCDDRHGDLISAYMYIMIYRCSDVGGWSRGEGVGVGGKGGGGSREFSQKKLWEAAPVPPSPGKLEISLTRDRIMIEGLGGGGGGNFSAPL